MSDSTTSPSVAERGDRIAAVLASRYGLPVRTVTQLPIGQGTTNFRVVCDDGQEAFVKNYPGGTDLDAEREAIALSARALEAGIPGAQVLPNQDGDVIDTSSLLAVSVWEWMTGQVVTRLSQPQLAAAGNALGRIHAAFTDVPAGAATGTVSTAQQWRDVDLEGLTATVDQLLEIIAERVEAGASDAFDVEAQRTLLERRGQLVRIPELLADLPEELTAQVVHGDFSPVNLLFEGETLSAVLDYRPPSPFLVAYDLGRMAFYPNMVAAGSDWFAAAATLIIAYRQAHPAVAAVDVQACGRVALLQLLKSLYGVRQHYLKPGLFQDDLDDFWLLRHRAVRVLLSELTATDTLLAGLANA
ncbi:phosphotransferase enzyme family protein [Streptosporangium sp. NBC_01756]|uniref:phosphotransferase enzyme family protein n=1 Tax=Streptosporangium sp. NBC_01756 TaxID=2975950 RepID=UPI002DDAAE7A|nr:phosphotransferase [Streptosporangium sp. NBC_01756]WSC85141.1 phosphotransferase [Streptosporangium sp. NBC_01756]